VFEASVGYTESFRQPRLHSENLSQDNKNETKKTVSTEYYQISASVETLSNP
jgi:hypothetical protein